MDQPGPQNGHVFEVTEACFVYNNQVSALDKVSLTVKAGECLAILGSNGSGKSTILKLLDGLYFPSSGFVFGLGQPLTEAAFQDDDFNFEFRRKVGLLFQDSDVQLFMPSVWEEVAFAPLQLGFKKEDVKERVEWALDTLKIDKLRDRAPYQLSGGEKKRVALASLLSLMPDIWLLDEPTTGLDPRSATWLMEFINLQCKAGKTLVIATHDLSIVEATADRVYVLNEDHRLQAEGTPNQILNDIPLLIKSNLARGNYT